MRQEYEQRLSREKSGADFEQKMQMMMQSLIKQQEPSHHKISEALARVEERN
jgi:hypothetical protein